MFYQRILFIIMILCGCVFTAGCGSSDSNDGDDKKQEASEEEEKDTSSETGTILVTESLSGSVPKDLAVTSITEKQSQESLQEAGTIQVDTFFLNDDESNDFYTKRLRLKKVIDAEKKQDCLGAIPEEFSFAQGNFGFARCFGPGLSYTNHPDTKEDGSFGNGDLGMFWPDAEIDQNSGIACSSQVINNLMNNVASYSDAAVGFQAFVACAARLDDIAPPAVGEEEDVLTSLSDALSGDQPFSIDSAKISRDEDTSDGEPVFVTTLTGKMKDVPRNLEKDFELTVRHIPTSDDNTAYKGVIQYRIKQFEGSNDAAISLLYAWKDKELNYRYRQFQRESGSEDLFDTETYEVDSSKEGSSWTEVSVKNDEFGFGKLSFTWDTFDYLVFNAETKSDGSGYAYFGHQSKTNEQRGSEASREIKGFKCYPKNPHPQPSEEFTGKIQKQVLNIDSASGKWGASESMITFAPTVSCDWNTSNDTDPPSASLTVEKEDEAGGKTNESISFPVDNDLENMTDYQSVWQAVTLPEVF